MALPTMTPEQRAKALEAAAAARAKTSAARAGLKDGSVKLADVLSSEDKAIKRMKVKSVLAALPGVGAKTTEKIMHEHEIDENRRIGGLGARQREALLERLGN